MHSLVKEIFRIKEYVAAIKNTYLNLGYLWQFERIKNNKIKE